MTGDMKDFNAFAEQVEGEVPALREQRAIREEAQAFQQRVRERLRRQRGRTPQEEVARRMGLRHNSTVSRIEKGDGDLTLETIYRYARALGRVPVLVLAPAAGEASASDQPAEAPAYPLAASHERILERLSDDLVQSYGEIGQAYAPARTAEGE
ncbi:MAG: helix-turn-helix transcriptional regulator [Acetobacterales bacterium]